MDILWKNLHTAYGTAEHVPALLKNLTSRKKAIFTRALEELWQEICHQGTIYSASPAVMAHLIELIKNKQTLMRDHLAYLIACLVDGCSYPVTAHYERITRSASSKGYRVYLSLLSDADPQVRMSTVFLLSRIHIRRQTTERALRTLFKKEKDVRVLATILMTLGAIGSRTTVAWCASMFRTTQDANLRLGAACAVLSLHRKNWKRIERFSDELAILFDYLKGSKKYVLCQRSFWWLDNPRVVHDLVNHIGHVAPHAILPGLMELL